MDFKNLPKRLKDPKNFEGVEKKLNNVLKSDHAHKTIKSYMTCAWCQEKYRKRQELMKKLGFESFQVYQEWKKIISLMKSEIFNENKKS